MNYPINFVKSSPRPAAASQFCGFPIPTRDQRIYFSFVDTLIQYNWPLRRIYHSTQTRKCPLLLFSRDRNLNQKSSILISLNSKSVGWGKGSWSKWNGMKPFKYFSFRVIKLTHPALNILIIYRNPRLPGVERPGCGWWWRALDPGAGAGQCQQGVSSCYCGDQDWDQDHPLLSLSGHPATLLPCQGNSFHAATKDLRMINCRLVTL